MHVERHDDAATHLGRKLGRVAIRTRLVIPTGLEGPELARLEHLESRRRVNGASGGIVGLHGTHEGQHALAVRHGNGDGGGLRQQQAADLTAAQLVESLTHAVQGLGSQGQQVLGGLRAANVSHAREPAIQAMRRHSPTSSAVSSCARAAPSAACAACGAS